MFLLSDGSLDLIYIAFLMVLVRLYDSLPTLEKLSTLVWWPVVLAWSWMGKMACNVPYAFCQRSLQMPLCTPHYTPTCHTYTHVLHHFSVWCCPCPLGSPGCFWWYYLPLNGLWFPFYHKCFLNIYLIPLCRALLCWCYCGCCYWCCCGPGWCYICGCLWF